MFVFSNFWTWLGILILVVVILNEISDIVSAARPRRNLRICRGEDFITIDIENAAKSDVDDAVASVTSCRKEIEKHD